MTTDESLKVLKLNKRLSKEESDNLERIVNVRQSTVDAHCLYSLISIVAVLFLYGTSKIVSFV